MRRFAILLTLLLLPALAFGGDASADIPRTVAFGEDVPADIPRTLPGATSVEEVLDFLLMPPPDGLASVQRGYIRYIAQNKTRDDMFRIGYWLGGEQGSVLDLTLSERYGVKLPYHAGNMCSRAIYSMALSYLGIDITPGGMSALLNVRNLDEPYDIISWMVGVDRVEESSFVFDTMMNNYLTNEHYSPVYLYFRRPNGTCHAVLVVAVLPETGRFLVVDCNPPVSGGKLHRVYFISLNKQRTEIINSTFCKSLRGSKVLQLYQWRLPEDTQATTP